MQAGEQRGVRRCLACGAQRGTKQSPSEAQRGHLLPLPQAPLQVRWAQHCRGVKVQVWPPDIRLGWGGRKGRGRAPESLRHGGPPQLEFGLEGKPHSPSTGALTAVPVFVGAGNLSESSQHIRGDLHQGLTMASLGGLWKQAQCPPDSPWDSVGPLEPPQPRL